MCRAAVGPAAMPNSVREGRMAFTLAYDVETNGGIDLIKHLNTGGQEAAGLA